METYLLYDNNDEMQVNGVATFIRILDNSADEQDYNARVVLVDTTAEQTSRF